MRSDLDLLVRENVSERDLSVTIGQRIRECRKRNGMTMVVLGRAAQCSQSFLSKVESGSLLPSVPMLFKISQALGVKPSFLLGEPS